MSTKESEYKEMFYAEAFENHEELDKLFTILEKNPKDKKSIDSIFRITHTLKGNAMGLGFDGIAGLSHAMEDIFALVKDKKVELDEELFSNLYRSNDKLGELINSLKNDKKVSYKGIMAKLRIYLDRLAAEQRPEASEETDKTPEIKEQRSTELKEEKVAQQETSGEKIEIIETVETIAEEEEEEEEEHAAVSFSDQVQIPVRKLDGLLTLVGELIIEKDTIIASSSEGAHSNEYSRLHRITSDMQYAVMDIRLVQVGFLFNKFHRVVRDVANIESKKVNLVLEGSNIEIDRNILKIISDSLVHLVRNAVSHGIENNEERSKSGKKEIGTLTLRAKNEKDTVIIEVEDDGHGIDTQIIKKKAIEKELISAEYAESLSEEEIRYLIFAAGFSNAEKITEISGRGVGMDVVKRATESIGGQVAIESELGKGSKVVLKLPSSMAVKGALLFELEKQEYAVPLSFTEAVVSIEPRNIHKVSRGLMANYLDNTMLLVFLQDLYELPSLDNLQDDGVLHKSYERIKDQDENLDVLIVAYNGKYVGFVVDKLLQQKEIVEKTLSKPLDQIELFSGATILGNGSVCLVLNIAIIIEKLFKEKRKMKVSYSKAG